jgi:hypothetical protein
MKVEKQKLTEPLADVLKRVGDHAMRVVAEEFKKADHNAGDKKIEGISNKQIKIAAVKLDPANEGKPYKEQLRAVVKASL